MPSGVVPAQDTGISTWSALSFKCGSIRKSMYGNIAYAGDGDLRERQVIFSCGRESSAISIHSVVVHALAVAVAVAVVGSAVSQLRAWHCSQGSATCWSCAGSLVIWHSASCTGCSIESTQLPGAVLFLWLCVCVWEGGGGGGGGGTCMFQSAGDIATGSALKGTGERAVSYVIWLEVNSYCSEQLCSMQVKQEMCRLDNLIRNEVPSKGLLCTTLYSVFVLQGGTPLHYFVWYDKRKERLDFLVSLLTDRDRPVEVNAKTEEGNTALHLAVKVSCSQKCLLPE